MMDFITMPAVVGICIYGFYKTLELFARKKERLLIAEKFGPPELPQNTVDSFDAPLSKNFFPTLRVGSLLIGLGLGLLVGFLITQFAFPHEYLNGTMSRGEHYYQIRDSIGIVYGASTLLFGGLGLICGFLVELRLRKKA